MIKNNKDKIFACLKCTNMMIFMFMGLQMFHRTYRILYRSVFPPDVELSHIKSDIFHKHLLQPTNFCKLFAHGYQMSDCIRSLAIRRIYLTDVSSCVEFLHTNISENLSEVSKEINNLSLDRCNALVKAKTLRMVTWDKHIF